MLSQRMNTFPRKKVIWRLKPQATRPRTNPVFTRRNLILAVGLCALVVCTVSFTTTLCSSHRRLLTKEQRAIARLESCLGVKTLPQKTLPKVLKWIKLLKNVPEATSVLEKCSKKWNLKPQSEQASTQKSPKTAKYIKEQKSVKKRIIKEVSVNIQLMGMLQLKKGDLAGAHSYRYTWGKIQGVKRAFEGIFTDALAWDLTNDPQVKPMLATAGTEMVKTMKTFLKNKPAPLTGEQIKKWVDKANATMKTIDGYVPALTEQQKVDAAGEMNEAEAECLQQLKYVLDGIKTPGS